jgi:hypothetical protein
MAPERRTVASTRKWHIVGSKLPRNVAEETPRRRPDQRGGNTFNLPTKVRPASARPCPHTAKACICRPFHAPRTGTGRRRPRALGATCRDRHGWRTLHPEPNTPLGGLQERSCRVGPGVVSNPAMRAERTPIDCASRPPHLYSGSPGLAPWRLEAPSRQFFTVRGVGDQLQNRERGRRDLSLGVVPRGAGVFVRVSSRLGRFPRRGQRSVHQSPRGRTRSHGASGFN